MRALSAPNISSLPSILFLATRLSSRHYINRLPGSPAPIGFSQRVPLQDNQRAGRKAGCLFPWLHLQGHPRLVVYPMEDHTSPKGTCSVGHPHFQAQITSHSPCFVKPGMVTTLLLPALGFRASIVVPPHATHSFIFGPFVKKKILF